MAIHSRIYFRLLLQYSMKPSFSTQSSLTRLVRPVSPKITEHASLHAPLPSRPAASSPPGTEARISDGRKEGEDGEAEGWRVRSVSDLEGNGVGV